MYFLYSVCLGAALILLLPVYAVKLKLLRKQRLHLAERLGFKLPAPAPGRPFLWIHAVSVGEVLSLQNLIHEVKSRHAGWQVGFSVLTPTGHKVAAAKLREVDHLFFVPFDIGWAVRRAFKKFRPRLLVLAESEFWPRLLREARRTGCPVLLVNGRISDRTFRRLRRRRWAARVLFSNIDGFLVQSGQDRERMELLGVGPDRLLVSGNLKCDSRLPSFGAEDIRRFKADLSVPEGRRVVVAGSIHKGEDEMLLQAFRTARETRPDVLLVLAPRHPEKFSDFEKSVENDRFIVRRRTRLEPGQAWDVLLLDTIGELARFYAIADAAFVGGSLVPWGGQNLLEPAYYGKPVFFGPHMKNFAALAGQFVAAGAARIVREPEELADLFLFKNPDENEAMGRKAKTLLGSLQGATEKTLDAIESYMSHAKPNA